MLSKIIRKTLILVVAVVLITYTNKDWKDWLK